MNLLQNASYVVYGVSTPFEAVGGVPPYSYSVLGGGAGGTIDPTTGLYTAPPAPTVQPTLPAQATDTIIATDSNLLTAQSTINVGIVPMAVCDIIAHELGLSGGRVYLWDQKIFEPTDSGVFIAVGILTAKVFSSPNQYVDDGSGGLTSKQSVNVWHTLTIDVISRDISAILQKEFVVMALNSNYAQQQQELNSFSIGRVPTSFVDLSGIDGSAIPYRFQISIGIQFLLSKESSVNFYNNFDPPDIITDP